jgi:hypothetical protein
VFLAHVAWVRLNATLSPPFFTECGAFMIDIRFIGTTIVALEHNVTFRSNVM